MGWTRRMAGGAIIVGSLLALAAGLVFRPASGLSRQTLEATWEEAPPPVGLETLLNQRGDTGTVVVVIALDQIRQPSGRRLALTLFIENPEGLNSSQPPLGQIALFPAEAFSGPGGGTANHIFNLTAYWQNLSPAARPKLNGRQSVRVTLITEAADGGSMQGLTARLSQAVLRVM